MCSSDAVLIDYGRSPVAKISLIEKWPPFFNTLLISVNTFFLSGTRFITQLLITTSIKLSSTGRSSISPYLNSTFLILYLSEFN
jgi:hypothetical protein